jgi:hypothetical protein
MEAKPSKSAFIWVVMISKVLSDIFIYEFLVLSFSQKAGGAWLWLSPPCGSRRTNQFL